MKKVYYVIFLVVLLLYLGIVFFLFGDDYKRKTKQDDEYIYFSYDHLWKYDGIEFQDVSDKANIYGEKKFYTYENGNYKGKYNFGLYEDELYLFDDQNNNIDYNGELLSFSKQKHTVYPLENQQLLPSDYDLIKDYFQKHRLDYSSLNVENVVKYLLDIDQDNQLEEIYNISNMLDEEKKEKGYSLIFIHDRGKIYELIKEIRSNEKSLSDGYSYSINNIADLDNDKKADFIIAKSNYGSPQICYLLIQKIKEQYQITKTC